MGNRRLFTWASDASRVLFTGVPAPPPGVAQPRHVVSDDRRDFTVDSSSVIPAGVSDNNPTTKRRVTHRAKASSWLVAISSQAGPSGSISSR